MHEATGSDLKFIIDYVKQRRGMSGVRVLLNELNKPSILFTGLADIGRSQIYSEEIYKKVIESAATTLGGDVRTRLNQLGYALGDRAKMTKFIAKFSTSKQLVRLLEDGIITDVPFVKSSVNEVSKHISILRITARKSGEDFLDVSDGYITAVLDQSGKALTISEKKFGNGELSYKFVLG
ncbi:MAG: hypothetical protein M0Z77_02080 [Thermoplasmatales archaeon]|jgi:hypothetical protein|nr:hypothetical protein [Candidatus Thermoplasmatota archaeon]MCL6003496.1 hypothetical protein [Candidatus Thermoplasmatota archaeon]MDA8054425.1 hypothetical protein [Thermoplasmatales archaeon]